jgi:hypothetical protein
MDMPKHIDTKWKDALLKTSLPLEYLVAKKLTDLKFGIHGEYHYLRPNEQGIQTEFSVDIWAVKHLSQKERGIWAGLNYLIECKYCHTGIKWLFAPHTKADTERLFERGIVHALDGLCTRQIFDKRPLWKLTNQFPMCFKGVELLPRDATAQNIERGRSQLRYGTPRLAIHLLESQMMMFNDQDLLIEFICPILVTTADIFVLNKGLDLKDFQNANKITDIAYEVPALILTNPYSHLFTSYAETIIADFHSKNPSAKERFEQLDRLTKKVTGEEETRIESFDFIWFNSDIRETAQRILVLNLKSLEPIIKLLGHKAASSGSSLTQVGYLEKDMSKMKTWVTEYKGK